MKTQLPVSKSFDGDADNVLDNLPYMTKITNSEVNIFLMMSNNTRIIIVSDHAFPLNHMDDLVYDVKLPGAVEDVTSFMPLLMVKDFNSSEFTISEEFMTNADVPALAFDDLIKNPTNPFTGNKISSEYKNNEYQYVSLATDFDISVNNGNSFLPSRWFKVSGDIKNIENWKFIYEECTVPDKSEK